MLKSNSLSVVNDGNFYKIQLDNTFLKSPKGNSVSFKSKSLANEALNDIYYLREHKDLKDYSVLKLVFTLLDRTSSIKKHTSVEKICKFFVSDSLLYWADESELNKLQNQHWQHVIEALNKKLNANLKPTYGLTLTKGVNHTLLKEYLQELNNKQIWLFEAISHLLESVGITYLIFNKLIEQEKAFKISFLHDFYSLKRWGEDKLKKQELARKEESLKNLVAFVEELAIK